MPYIPQESRKLYDDDIDVIVDSIISQTVDDLPGHLNYVLSSIVKRVLESTRGRYKNHNELMGVMVCTLLEFYRTNTAPYEDIKIAENGEL